MSPLTWDDLISVRVGIYGFGSEGQATLRACQARGIRPVVVDDSPRGSAVTNYEVQLTSLGGLESLTKCDVVIKTPGISPRADSIRSLQEAGVTIVGALGLWIAGHSDLERVVCITGTKGKSTTASIAGQLIRGLGHRCFTGGNLGIAPFDPNSDSSSAEYWVIEVSSYQAVTCQVAPPVTLVTSLHPDHLPWHGGQVESYYRDKLSLCSRPGSRITIANGDSAVIRAHQDLLAAQVDWVQAPRPENPDWDWIKRLGLLGEHNARNAALAIEALRQMEVPGAWQQQRLLGAAEGFRPLPNRLEQVGQIGEILFVDDGLSTNVLPTLAAVDAFPDLPVALIVGGLDRGIDYTALADGLRARNHPLLLLTIPDSGPRIMREVLAGDPGTQTQVQLCTSLQEAVERGFSWLPGKGVVLLSPAAPSFGHYQDYKDRGRDFLRAIETLPAP